MSNKFEPRLVRTILAVSIAAIGVATQPFAWADDADDEMRRLISPTSEIELGLGHVTKDSYKFGDYTGLQRAGTHMIGNILISTRDDETLRYFQLTGRNLGFDSRSLKIEGGEQGNYGLRLEYDQIPKLWSDSYQTPFTNPGSTNLTLPAGWVRGTATSNLTLLNASMRPFKVDTQRNTLGFGMTKQLAAGWDVEVRGKHEEKDGNRFIGATFGTGGGNPRAATLPEPVNYNTDEIEALVRYTSKKLQLQFGYFGSFFQNVNNGLIWSNPFANSVWSNLPANQGQIGLPPDNQFHQLSASGGYSFTKATRLAGSLSLGRMTQNDTFLPYSVNSGLTVTTPMPRSSLDGRINTKHADLRLTSLLMPKLNFSAAYRYDERDNKTPQAQYIYIAGDSMNQPGVAAGQARTNLPGSSTKQQVDAELDYHYSANTKLKLGYGYDWAKKTYEAITDEHEHVVKAEVHQHFNDMVSGGLGYAYADRKTSAYNASAPFIASYSTGFLATQAATGLWDNLPAQKKFFMAPRQRDKVRAFVNVSPTDTLDLQFGVDYKDDSYKESQYGLQKARGWAVNFDASLAATDALTGHIFASAENYGTLQRSLQFQNALPGGVPAKLTPTNGQYDYTYDIDDRTYTAGAGFRYKPLRKYEVGGDLLRAISTGKISVWTAPGIVASSATPLPDLSTRLSRLDLFGQYQLKKDVALKVKYIYEHYSARDWAYDQVAANTLANVIGTNQVSPKYAVHFIGVSVAYQF